jgi:epoxyqueuosine reductase
VVAILLDGSVLFCVSYWFRRAAYGRVINFFRSSLKIRTRAVNSSQPVRIALLTLREIVAELARDAGFPLSGVATADDCSELDYFPQWIAEGRAGDMAWLEQRNDHGELKRRRLQAALPWANSVIMFACSYDSSAPLSTDAAPPGTGWIARYAQPGSAEGGAADYHAVLLGKLRGVEAALHGRLLGVGVEFESRSYVDTGPLVERVYAQQAGLGWTGKNTCLIHPEHGSWLFLSAIVTSLDVTDWDLAAALLPDRCGTCTRCIDACPTNALGEPYRMDASLCIAYLTIEKKGSTAEELREGMGRNVFGCDICQDVCPWNDKARRSGAAPSTQFATVRQELVNPSLAWLASLDREQFRQLFRGSPLERTKWRGVMRNVAIAMGNDGDPSFLPQLRAWAFQHEEPTLAEAARWAVARIADDKNEV